MKKLPFAAEKDSREFMRKLIRLLIREVDERRSRHVSAENVQVFHHGRGWTFQRQERDGYSAQEGELELQSTRCIIEVDRILSHDVSLVPDFIEGTAHQMEEGMLQVINREMVAVTEQTNNVVSFPREGPVGEVFLNMIRNLELSVGPDGTVSRPTLYLAPDAQETLLERLAQLGPDYDRQLEDLWRQKEEQARERERQRLARYPSTT